MYEHEFSKRLSELRIKKGVSARDMSLSIGQNSGYINHIENRQAFPSLPVFFTICEYLGISPEQFFSAESKDPARITSILNDLRTLDEEQLYSLSVIIGELAKAKRSP